MKSISRIMGALLLTVLFVVFLTACGKIGDILNVAPAADAGPDQSVNAGDMVILNGSGSSDPNGDLLTFSWAFISIPSGSRATLNNPTSVNPTFTVDVAGTY